MKKLLVTSLLIAMLCSGCGDTSAAVADSNSQENVQAEDTIEANTDQLEETVEEENEKPYTWEEELKDEYFENTHLDKKYIDAIKAFVIGDDHSTESFKGIFAGIEQVGPNDPNYTEYYVDCSDGVTMRVMADSTDGVIDDIWIAPVYPYRYKAGIKVSSLVEKGYYTDNGGDNYSVNRDKLDYFSFWDYDASVYSLAKIVFNGRGYLEDNSLYLVIPIVSDATGDIMYDNHGNDAYIEIPLSVEYETYRSVNSPDTLEAGCEWVPTSED